MDSLEDEDLMGESLEQEDSNGMEGEGADVGAGVGSELDKEDSNFGLEEGLTQKESPMGDRICANATCDQSDGNLFPASSAAIVYFKLHYYGLNKRHYICGKCAETAAEYREECVKRLKNNMAIVDIPTANGAGTVQLDDDSDAEDETFRVAMTEKEIAGLVKDMIVRTNLQSQANLCKNSLAASTDKLKSKYEELSNQLRMIETDVDKARELYYQTRPYHFGIMKLKSIDIDQYGNVRLENELDEGETTAEVVTTPAKAVATKSTASSHQRRSDGASRSVDSCKKQDTKEDTVEVEELRIACHPGPKSKLFDTPPSIPRVMPRKDDKVYAMKKTSLFGWTLGEVDEVVKGPSNKNVFKVRFEVKKRGKGGEYETAYTYKDLTAKQLAYNIPCPFVLPVGTRVIGLFKDDCAEDEGVPAQESMYYAGIVAEPPKNTNRYRYLVFFDDGYAQYVDTTEVLLVCESSNPVWVDVHPDSQEFIKQYIQKYPERPMVRLTKGAVLSTEWSGKWWLSRVVEVDCSLAKMHFQADNRYEWIYRGSTRLSPLYESEKRNAARVDKTGPVHPSRSLPRNNRENSVTIEYLYGNEEVFQKKLPKPVARKSTAGGNNAAAQRSSSDDSGAVVVRNVARPTGIPNSSFLEFEGKMAKIALPAGVAQPRDFKAHRCGPDCVIPYDENNADFKRVNPLAIPLFLGWGREVAKTPRRQIFYRSPCGKRLRDFSELHRFLLESKFTLSIDHYTFDQNVDCLSEFQASRVLFSIKDISYGKEIKPVQAINSLDHDYPEYVEYTSERVRGVGVPLDLNPDFLVCCDCTDDCQDKRKCACWRLTYEGYRKTKDDIDIDKIGYNYRLLKEHIVSGIYECNSRCKCRSTCLNRVAQNKMKWILQVFKTSNKGWAIRPLHDIPEGSFICVYAGQLLTEQGANEDGKNFGDEYLAELDFIEICEKFKEGYESTVKDPEDDLDLDEELKNSRYGKRGYVEEIDEDSMDGVSMSRRQPSGFTAKIINESSSRKKQKVQSGLTTRDYYNKGEQCFIMDAKSIGNIGRYLNHCCSPNVYVQNVFVDTHDVRFPWVAFFAYKTIRAGTEMTWDYNYDIGSVPDKTMYCQCGSPECRGRLL